MKTGPVSEVAHEEKEKQGVVWPEQWLVYFHTYGKGSTVMHADNRKDAIAIAQEKAREHPGVEVYVCKVDCSFAVNSMTEKKYA